MENTKTCSKCTKELLAAWTYCPWCGVIIVTKPPDTSIAKQLFIYIVSFALAPLGLAWGIRYVRSNDKKARVVGAISILLTFLAIGLTIYATSSLMSYYSHMLDGLTKGTYPY